MATRFMYKALATAALGIALSPLLAAATATSSASSNTTGAFQLEPPEAPSNGIIRTMTVRKGGRDRNYTYTTVSWTDNSSNEEGFIIEAWRRIQSGEWVLRWTVRTAENTPAVMFGGRAGGDYRFRAKAFNASGDSAWSNWAH